ncbi:hypothetical protein [Winogradskyella poriferorum]|jgi:hypothetical protein|uniref:hypothetical protein n=1 Tax=Winogradskyella poriferorum TaxID=307627 RepID=UPI003D652569
MVLELENLDSLIALIVAIMFGPSIILTIVGLAQFRKNKKTAKILFIIATVYLIVSLGICGALIMG